MTYFNWSPQEPNNYGGDQDCVTIGEYDNEKWDDDTCSNEEAFVCETKSSLALGTKVLLTTGVGSGHTTSRFNGQQALRLSN